MKKEDPVGVVKRDMHLQIELIKLNMATILRESKKEHRI